MKALNLFRHLIIAGCLLLGLAAVSGCKTVYLDEHTPPGDAQPAPHSPQD